MPKLSAGLLLYRPGRRGAEVFLVHPGGPFYRKKDEGVWSVPKGEHAADENALDVALREFAEETGIVAPVDQANLIDLGTVKQRSGKVVSVWAGPGDIDAGSIRSNEFTVEWPPKSGQQESFPEVDRAAWFDLPTAKIKLLPAQSEFVDRLAATLGEPVPAADQPDSGSQGALFKPSDP